MKAAIRAIASAVQFGNCDRKFVNNSKGMASRCSIATTEKKICHPYVNILNNCQNIAEYIVIELNLFTLILQCLRS